MVSAAQCSQLKGKRVIVTRDNGVVYTGLLKGVSGRSVSVLCVHADKLECYKLRRWCLCEVSKIEELKEGTIYSVSGARR